ncbi:MULTISPECIES: hypothetical protein [Paenibacillus]|uniref:DUF1269 domain-containing protein n=1 Tax=Paenibacillus rhizophilus TaxID=1850366 RepID=A0A3N9Q2F4_9BACL|nr:MULTISPECIES: hypothetical protein [Paenibacillus]RQW11696.1 hypothetical protein EH198_11855 [Paenibacillus rhizophilus]BCG60321.1 hypothetical protein PUR_37460 [Paenibacillus sp. URB8-2]
MSEKSILAYFKSPEEAEGVSRKLQSLRVVDLSIDRFSRYGGGFTSHADPASGLISSLGTAAAGYPDAGVMAAADPSASGMSHGGSGGPTGRDILLTVVVDEASFHQALSIIEEAGGMI